MTVEMLEGFAGPGGMSEAARMVGITNTVGIEIHKDACATAQSAGHARLRRDIRTLDPSEFPAVQQWVSTPPCPTFSEAGKQSGIGDYPILIGGVESVSDVVAASTAERRALLAEQVFSKVTDPRTALVLETLNVALMLPDVQWLVAEQVPPVRDIWIEIAAELAAMHRFEAVNVITLRADDFGAATRRTRVFLIATRDYVPDLTGMPIRAWWEAGRFHYPIEVEPQLWTPFPRTLMAAALDWPAGITVNTRGDRKTPGGNLFSADGPAPSLTGNGARSWYRTDLGKENGQLEAWQAGVLQGFPKHYPWQGSRSSQFQQIADSVVPLVGAAVIGAASGRPWVDAVWQRLEQVYGHKRPDTPHLRLCADRKRSGQMDLFEAAA